MHCVSTLVLLSLFQNELYNCTDMERGGGGRRTSRRLMRITADDVFNDFKARRNGIIKALTSGTYCSSHTHICTYIMYTCIFIYTPFSWVSFSLLSLFLSFCTSVLSVILFSCTIRLYDSISFLSFFLVLIKFWFFLCVLQIVKNFIISVILVSTLSISSLHFFLGSVTFFFVVAVTICDGHG